MVYDSTGEGRDVIDFREYKKRRDAPREYRILQGKQDNLFGEKRPSFLDILVMEQERPEKKTGQSAGHLAEQLEMLIDIEASIDDCMETEFKRRGYLDFQSYNLEEYEKFLETAAVYFLRNRGTEGPEISVKAYTRIRRVMRHLITEKLQRGGGLEDTEEKMSRLMSEFHQRVSDEALKNYYRP